jgi:hypothetical protein
MRKKLTVRSKSGRNIKRSNKERSGMKLNKMLISRFILSKISSKRRKIEKSEGLRRIPSLNCKTLKEIYLANLKQKSKVSFNIMRGSGKQLRTQSKKDLISKLKNSKSNKISFWRIKKSILIN